MLRRAYIRRHKILHITSIKHFNDKEDGRYFGAPRRVELGKKVVAGRERQSFPVPTAAGTYSLQLPLPDVTHIYFFYFLLKCSVIFAENINTHTRKHDRDVHVRI